MNPTLKISAKIVEKLKEINKDNDKKMKKIAKCEIYFAMSVCLCVCLSALNNSVHTVRIFCI